MATTYDKPEVEKAKPTDIRYGIFHDGNRWKVAVKVPGEENNVILNLPQLIADRLEALADTAATRLGRIKRTA
jgi:hypothetical protein